MDYQHRTIDPDAPHFNYRASSSDPWTRNDDGDAVVIVAVKDGDSFMGYADINGDVTRAYERARVELEQVIA